MELHFFKYQGTGNDFILLDNRNLSIQLSEQQIALLCNRHFGIGADGLMLLEPSDKVDFKMVYYNSDGKQSSMCGNGGRCISLFAKHLGIIQDDAAFEAIDGLHYSKVSDSDVELKMNQVKGISQDGDAFVLNTGSPHYIKFVDNAMTVDVRREGAAIRYNTTYAKEGINVNFVSVKADKTLVMATYERGVEDETLSCGTGVTAAALVQVRNNIGLNYVRVQTKGGILLIKCKNMGNNEFEDIYLCGPAAKVFEGKFSL